MSSWSSPVFPLLSLPSVSISVFAQCFRFCLCPVFPFLFLPSVSVTVSAQILLGRLLSCRYYTVSSVSVAVVVSHLPGRLMSFRYYSSPVSSWSSPVFSLQFQPGLFLETRSWSKWDWTATLIDVWWPFSSLASLLLCVFSWPLRVRGSVAWLQLWPASHLENGRKTGQLGWSLRILPNSVSTYVQQRVEGTKIRL